MRTTEPLKHKRISEKQYWDMLEVLPPERYAKGEFLVGEPMDYNERGQAVYGHYKETTSENDKRTHYFLGYTSAQDFEKMHNLPKPPYYND